MTEQMNVPKLRFGEFEGEWSKHKIGELCDFIVPGRTKPKTFTGNTPWITTPDLKKGAKTYVSASGLGLSQDEIKQVSAKVVPEGSIIMSCVGELGVLSINGSEVVINQQLHAFIPKVSDTNFLLQSLSTKGRYIDRIATKTALPYMNKENCNSIPIETPTLPEQQKIASFLSKVDEKIGLLSEKKDKLTEYKLGVMQQLLNGKWQEQDGQLTFMPPTLRFKADDGSEFPDWEEYKKQIKIVAGNAYKADEYSDSGYLLIQGQNIFPDELKLDETPKHISSKSSNHTKIIKGDIVLGLNRPITNGKLKTCRYPIGDPSVLYQRAGKLEFNANEVDSEFLFQYITSPEFMRQLKLELVGSDQPYIKSNLFGVTKNIFPSIDEQRKISSFLASLNIKLDLVNSELEKAKEWKKGLLQQMFV